MYANALSFEPNLTIQTLNSIRDVSFSSYLNKADENMVRKLTNEYDDEIGVFGAEKYFKGEIEDMGNKNELRFIHTINSQHKDAKFEDFDQITMHTPSVRSNASCNSRSSLTRTFLGRFGCYWMNKKSTRIDDKMLVYSKGVRTNICTPSVRSNVTEQLSSKLAEAKTRSDYFSFPVLNSTVGDSNSSLNSKVGNLAGKVEVNGMYNSSSIMYNSDANSDSSSDLFEIDSFSPAGNVSVFGHGKTESSCYAPSEVSIDWSVVTKSVADFEEVRAGGCGRRNCGRVKDNKNEQKKQKKRSGFLSGCASHKAVRVVRDEYKV